MKRIIIALSAVMLSIVSSATQYSCLSLITAAKQAGKWDALKSWISSAGLMDEWNKCSYISDEYPQYAQVTNQLVESGIVTTAEIESILAASKDTAISDKLISRVYNSDMGTENGRRRWHGKVTATSYDTNTLTKVQIHEDGYRHEAKFTAATSTSIDDKIAAAERKAMYEEMKRKRAEAVEKARLSRIADLQTNMAYNVQITMTAKRWPEDLATVYLQHELNTLLGTNTVNAVVTPQ